MTIQVAHKPLTLTLSPQAGRGDAIAAAARSGISVVAGRCDVAALPFSPLAGRRSRQGDEGQTASLTNSSFKQEALHAPRS
ncbi:hypothetical protein DMY87_09840 [Rhizobium wuzhouense]|uniref:Uncharacterized protein n=1 Tax=Rhizobium wuzhouense TaxID=1986026 RepID=A0ABX5NRP9_9HYPH|nr:hypothetical protein DMY87_09840 [Rhizobium wuzhouense]